MSIRPVSQRAKLLLSTALLFSSALFALVAESATLPGPTAAADVAPLPGACPSSGVAAEAIPAATTEQPVVFPARPARVVVITGVVETVEKTFFGRPERIAIVSVNDEGILVQNPVEDVAAGGDLKRHVGDAVTARGLILVKVDGTPSLVVDAFQVHEESTGIEQP